jgi:hypothetical protein
MIYKQHRSFFFLHVLEIKELPRVHVYLGITTMRGFPSPFSVSLYSPI